MSIRQYSFCSSTAKFLQLRYRCLLIASVLVGGNMMGGMSAIAASPTPGTVIENQATGSYVDTADNQTKTVASDVVKITVAEVTGITVTATGTSGSFNPGQTVYFTYTITNVGNDPTQFFIPSAANLSGSATQASNIEITGYSIDGTSLTSLGTPIVIPNGGGQTGRNSSGTAGLLKTPNPNGEFQPNGYIAVRVPVLINANANNGDTVAVRLGDTPVDPASSTTPQARLQNQPFTAGSNDVYTVDNPDSLGVVNEAAGNPINGDTNHRQEASAVAQISVTVPLRISGKVFEDVNYGGGAGRDYAAANASAVSSGWISGAIGSGSAIALQSTVVELYQKSVAGTFLKVGTTTTDTSGNYSFSVATSGTYRVRVINSTVRSIRPGYVYGVQIPVQTFRYDPDEAIAANRSIANEVGGLKPSEIDANPVADNLPLPIAAQSQTEVVINSSGISGADFGFNFDTIVNTNDAGQGSLRQFIANSNALGNTNLNQDESANSVASAVTKNAGIEHSIFMIPNAADPLGRPADSSYTSSSSLDGGGGSTFKITLTTGGLTVTAPGTAIDGRTQTALTGDTNPAFAGTSTGPEVVITGNGLLSLDLLTVAGDNMLIDSVGLVKAHNALTGIGALGRGLVIGGANLIGVSNPIIARNSTIALNDTNGILVSGATANSGNGIQVINNVIRNNGSGNSLGNVVGAFGNGIALATNGLSLTDGSIKNLLIQGNSVTSNTENGVKILLSVSPNIVISNLNIQNNTITNNGTGATTAKDGISIEAVVNASNVSAISSSAIKDSQIFNNQIASNAGNGISLVTHVDFLSVLTSLLTDPISAITITQNSIFSNNALGIDLEKSVLLSPQSGVTPNDNNDTDIGPNEFLNFPVIESAKIVGQNLVIRGWASPGAKIELFNADAGPNPNPLPSGYTKSFGEGQTYLLTLQEGGTVNGITDTDNTQSTYTNDGTGATSSKTEHRFLFTIPVASIGTTVGSRLTTTATVNNSTSEFSGVTQVSTDNPNVLLVKRITAINGGTTTTGGDNLAIYNQDDAYPYDDNVIEPSLAPSATFPTADTDKWPNTIAKSSSSFLIGGITGGQTKPQDEVEYTIYFLSTGTSAAKNVTICDRIPAHQTFVADAFNSLTAAPNTAPADPPGDRGIAVSQGSTPYAYTNIGDGDTARYYPPGSPLPSACTQPALTEDNGAVVVNLGDVPNVITPGSPTKPYGFVRFRAQVK